MTDKNKERIYKMSFASVYPHYITKAQKKDRTQDEVDQIIFWLTGYNKLQLEEILANNVNFEDFYQNAPDFNPNAVKITGTICGDRIEEIEEDIIRKVRYLDKLIDELAKGKALEKILRN